MKYKEKQAEREEEEKLMNYQRRFDELTDIKLSKTSRNVEPI